MNFRRLFAFAAKLDQANIMEIDLNILHAMIGCRVSFGNDSGTVLEILDDGPSLVICMDHGDIRIQEDCYGNPKKRRAEMRIVQVLTQDGSDYSEAFLQIQEI